MKVKFDVQLYQLISVYHRCLLLLMMMVEEDFQIPLKVFSVSIERVMAIVFLDRAA